MVNQNSADHTASATAGVLAVMRKRPRWSEAVERLRDLAVSRGDGPQRAAEAYGEVYHGRRGAMVFDVVVSRQRKYQSVVLPRVEKWAAAVGEPSLAKLAQGEVEAKQFGLQRTEPVTLKTVATNLLAFCRAEGALGGRRVSGVGRRGPGPRACSEAGPDRGRSVGDRSGTIHLHAHAMWRRRVEAGPPGRRLPPRAGVRRARR